MGGVTPVVAVAAAVVAVGAAAGWVASAAGSVGVADVQAARSKVRVIKMEKASLVFMIEPPVVP
jgi:hypothetical protein